MGVLERRKISVSDAKQTPPAHHQSAESIQIRSRESSVESAARSQASQPPNGYRAFFSRPGQKPERRDFDSHTSRSRFSRCGTKKQRRRDNYHSLLALREEDEEITPHDIINREQSAFAALLQNCHKMEVWNTFLACSEEEQEAILATDGLWIDGLDQLDAIPEEGETSRDSAAVDRRNHPNLTAMEAYDRLNAKLKTVLKRRQLPMGTLCYFEEEVTQFFAESPKGMITMEISCSFDRLLLHAVCEFHFLSSMSFAIDPKRRGTIIKNRFENFSTPDMSLGAFVEMKFGSKRS